MADAGEYGLDKSHLNITETYRDFQLGHITEKITIVDSSISLSDVLSRETALEKASSRIELFKGKAITAYLENDTVRFYALDFCEKAFSEVIKIEDRKIAYLVVYEGTHFLGVIAVNHLIRHVSRIRELAYEQARYIQQFFLQKSARPRRTTCPDWCG
jgi:hypothetical protein